VRGCYFGLRPQIGKKQIVPSCIWRPLPFLFPGLAAGRRPAAHYSSSFSSPIAFGAVGTVSGFAHSEKSFAHADAGLNGERAWADKWMRCFIRNNSLLSADPRRLVSSSMRKDQAEKRVLWLKSRNAKGRSVLHSWADAKETRRINALKDTVAKFRSAVIIKNQFSGI